MVFYFHQLLEYASSSPLLCSSSVNFDYFSWAQYFSISGKKWSNKWCWRAGWVPKAWRQLYLRECIIMIVLTMVASTISFIFIRFLNCCATLSQLFTGWLQTNSTGIRYYRHRHRNHHHYHHFHCYHHSHCRHCHCHPNKRTTYMAWG